MKMKVLTLCLVAALAACNKAPANNVAGNASAGLALPPDRSAAAPQAGQQGAMPVGLDCVRNRLTPEQRQAVAQAAMEQAPREDSRVQTLLQTVEACGDDLSWSPQKRQAAALFSISAAGAAGLREEFRGQGIQIEEMDPIIMADRELMAAAESNQLTAETGQSFAIRHQAELERIAGGRSLESELGTRMGNYLGFVALAQVSSQRFASAP